MFCLLQLYSGHCFAWGTHGFQTCRDAVQCSTTVLATSNATTAKHDATPVTCTGFEARSVATSQIATIIAAYEAPPTYSANCGDLLGTALHPAVESEASALIQATMRGSLLCKALRQGLGTFAVADAGALKVIQRVQACQPQHGSGPSSATACMSSRSALRAPGTPSRAGAHSHSSGGSRWL